MSRWMKRIETQETQGQGGGLSKLFETDRRMSDFSSMVADNGNNLPKATAFQSKIFSKFLRADVCQFLYRDLGPIFLLTTAFPYCYKATCER